MQEMLKNKNLRKLIEWMFNLIEQNGHNKTLVVIALLVMQIVN
ncbi:hypothetical protein [Rickettsia endosymbiont of Rhinocyllus conicus]